ncbi:hypothetical protein BGX30_002017, partial [Mortierella sp. GBA39]
MVLNTNNGEQQRTPSHPGGKHGKRNGCHKRADGIQGDELTRHSFGNIQPFHDVRQQPGWNGFRENTDKTGHGKRQQRQPGKPGWDGCRLDHF